MVSFSPSYMAASFSLSLQVVAAFLSLRLGRLSLSVWAGYGPGRLCTSINWFDNNNRFVCCLTFKHIFDDIRNFTWVHYIWFYCSVLKDTQDRPYLGLKYHDYSRKLKKLTTYILYLKLAILLNTTVYKFTFHRI